MRSPDLRSPLIRACACALPALGMLPAACYGHAEEGMWTFDNPPAKVRAPPKTTRFGYDRSASFNNAEPSNLPSRRAEGRDKLNLATSVNFVTTNDIIGGNSRSLAIDREGRIVGPVFDGNIESLAGDFVYDGETNRTVAVHTAAMTEALTKLYGAGKLLEELEDGAK